MFRHALAALLVSAALPAFAQAPAPLKLPADVASFFSGQWSGKGAFASGRPIEADVAFTPELDGAWMSYRHTDRAPNTYKALSMWGARKDGGLAMVVFDSMGGQRELVSSGWVDGKLTFARGEGAREEHFVFEKIDARHFRMTYEVRKDGAAWRMVDALVFERAAAAR
ncbi:hypothetical protein E4L96_19615 [Massilia arenosa]|uniref:DUF1579 domain-containing protein n=1 Tax=Zemynaea arenosa TaxID=2561931 RepID=A0A4Y9RWB9_9BURK|nr:hypothetical protein [Massilia arenosa]TFW13587.1 hypothetical protein E4L96_19615 [Massilia arenosa]